MRHSVYLIAALLSIVWVFVYFALMDQKQPGLIVIAVSGGMVLHAMMYGPQAALITEQFPARVRYAGSSLAYTLTGVIAGGFDAAMTQLIGRTADRVFAPSKPSA